MAIDIYLTHPYCTQSDLSPAEGCSSTQFHRAPHSAEILGSKSLGVPLLAIWAEILQQSLLPGCRVVDQQE